MIQQQLPHQKFHSSGNTIQLILIRHGIALHNVMHHHQQHHHQHHQQHPHPPPPPQQQQYGPTRGNDSNDNIMNINISDDNYLFDPQLTVDGKIQAVIVGETVRQFVVQQQQQQQQHHQKLNCRILTSPLTRCLQTATYAFGIPQDYGSTNSTAATGTNPTATTTATTIQCHENLREACGIHHCDRRRTKTQLQQFWGHMIQFIHHDGMSISSDHDSLWHATRRETIYELQCRI
jgi:hypothetical protein